MRKRADNNQRAITAALRAGGACIVDLHELGKGCPDLLLSYKGQTLLCEVKNPNGYNRFTPAQVAFRQAWQGRIETIRDESEALTLLENIYPP
jgi:hypothetical protein